MKKIKIQGKIRMSKEEKIIADIVSVNKKYKNKFKNASGYVTRNFYREHGKFKESEVEKLFGNFTNALNEAFEKQEKITRDYFDIRIKLNCNNKRYFVSAIVAGMPVNEKFMQSILNYCDKEKAELILLVMRGVSISDNFEEEVLSKYSKYFHTDVQFNENLRALDFMLCPQQIISLTGLSRLTKKGTSLIVAHTKLQMESVPSRVGEFYHLMYSTGCVNLPNYKTDRIGSIAKQDHTNSGLIVEIENKNIFHIRNVVSDRSNGFCDLGKYYKQESISDIENHIVLGDSHIGIEDKRAHDVSKEMINYLKPTKIFFHDLIDFHSVNPHEKNDMFARYERNENQKSLEKELNYAGQFLEDFIKDFSKTECVSIPSNHVDFLDRYLTSGQFVFDSVENAKLACELFSKKLEGVNPIKYFFETRKYKLNNFIFPEREDVLNSWGIDHIHGDYGNNGARGSIRSLDVCYSNNISGHSHSASIFRNSYKVGTLSKLIQRYNKNGGSSWTMTNGIIYKNGTIQLINIVNGKWRMC